MTVAQQEALDNFFNVVDYHTLYDLSSHLTCREADSWIELLMAFGERDNASCLLDGHVEGDDEGDSHHQWTEADQRQELNNLEEKFAEPVVTGDEIVAGLQKIVEDVK